MDQEERKYHLAFTDLAPMDIAVFYLGTVQRVRDAQERQTGPRSRQRNSPSARVELAVGYQRVAEERLRALTKEDPEKAREVCEWLHGFVDRTAVAMAEGIERELEAR